MAVEDHPLFPKWKAALERLIKAKERLEGVENLPNWRAYLHDYNMALYEYTRISEEL